MIVESGRALYFRDPRDLGLQLSHAWSHLSLNKSLKIKADHFVERYICAYGNQAAEKIAKHLRQC